jgi:hypothetical protein
MSNDELRISAPSFPLAAVLAADVCSGGIENGGWKLEAESWNRTCIIGGPSFLAAAFAASTSGVQSSV